MNESMYIEQLNQMAKMIQELSDQIKILREENEYLKKKYMEPRVKLQNLLVLISYRYLMKLK